jgi:hypothetical protein
MTDSQRIEKAEELVSNVLIKTFNQQLDADKLHSVAQKVAKAVKVTPPAPPKRAA